MKQPNSEVKTEGVEATRGPEKFRKDLRLRIVVFVVLMIGLIYILCSACSNPATTNPAASEQDSIKSIADFTRAVGKSWWYWAASITAVSTLSMALVEFLKALFNIRRWYQEARLRAWIKAGAGAHDAEVFAELVFLAIGDLDSLPALCSQPLEKMMGEIQPAANIALDSPRLYPALYTFLTDTDLPSTTPSLDARRSERASLKDVGSDRAAVDRELHFRHAWPRPTDAQEDSIHDTVAEDDKKVRLRLANLMSRKLDAFQLRTQYYWERGNQLAATLISVSIVFAALSQDGELTSRKLMLGLFSGIVSPFVKDLASSLREFSSKT